MPGDYAPHLAGSGTSTSSSPLSGSGGSATFLVPTDLGTPSSPVPRPARGDSDFAGVFSGKAPTFTDSGELVASLYKMDKTQLADLQAQLKLAGYGRVTASGYVDDATIAAYGGLLQDTARYAAAGGQGYTPETLLAAKTAASNEANGALGATAGSALSDPNIAQRLVNSALNSHLGRRASEQERAQFQSLLAGYAGQANSSETGAAQLADNFATADQGRANEAGALNETRFVDVLHKLMSGG